MVVVMMMGSVNVIATPLVTSVTHVLRTTSLVIMDQSVMVSI